MEQTDVVPVIHEIARRATVPGLHPLLDRKRRDETRCSGPDWSTDPWTHVGGGYALTRLMPVTSGMTLDLMRCAGESDPAFLTSAKNLGNRLVNLHPNATIARHDVPFPVLLIHVMRRKRVWIQLTRRRQLWEPFAQILAVRDQTHGREGVVR